MCRMMLAAHARGADMIEKYNAFISYRHVERDIKVAEDIQNQLEHFKIPKAIAEKTGVQKIERIFRDKSELPITSNLTDDIQTALKNSDFLIVICSPEVLESLWVRREIELFLKTHPYERILTVLSAGEPQTAIPDLLLKRRIETVDENGRPVVIEEPTEPLSCDYRLPLKQARKVELPRLAAALIGCSYDELVQRAEQYRLRRWRLITGSVAAASAVALSYLIWSNRQISHNLEQSQKNMSLYLAEESGNALENQDRLRAVWLALKALPSETENRPIISEAEYALAEAARVYKLPSVLEYTAVRLFETEYDIRDFLISPDRTVMTAIDQEDNLYLWKLPEGELICTQKLPQYTSLFDGGETGFYASANYSTQLLSWQDGSVIWENDDPSHSLSLYVQKESGRLLKWTEEQISLVSEDGKTIRTMAVPELAAGFRMETAALDPSGTKALLVYRNNSQSAVVLADLESGATKLLRDDLIIADRAEFLDDGTVLICEMANPLNEISEESFDQSYYLYNMHANIWRLAPESGEVIFKTAIPFSQEGYFRSYERIAYLDSEGQTQDGLLCNLATVQAIVNLSDGSIFKMSEWPAIVRNTISRDEETIFTLLSDGSLGINSFNDNYVSGIKAFIGDAEKAVIYDKEEGSLASVMVMPEGKPYIIQYVPADYPPGYQQLDRIQTRTIESAIMRDDRLAMEYRDDSHNRHIAVFDINSQQTVLDYETDFNEDAAYLFSQDGSMFYVVSDVDDHIRIAKMSLSDGSRTDSFVIDPDLILQDSAFSMKDSLIRYVCYVHSEEGNVLKMAAYDCMKGEELSGAVIDSEGFPDTLMIQNCVFSEDSKSCLLEIRNYGKDTQKNELYYLTAGQKPFLLDASDEPHYPGLFNSSSTAFATVFNGEITVYDMSGQPTGTISFKPDSYLSAAYLNDELYLLTNEGAVYRYSAKNELLMKYSVGIYANSLYVSSDRYEWQQDAGSIYLQANGILSVIDPQQSFMRACIQHVLGIAPAHSAVIVSDTSSGVSYAYPGIMPLYTTEELIQTGREIVRDYEPKE